MSALLRQLLQKLKKSWRIILLLDILLILVLGSLHLQQEQEDVVQTARNCYLPEEYPNDDGIYRLRPHNALSDVLLTEHRPLFRRTIFLLETGCSLPPRLTYNRLQLTTSQACAIESAAQLSNGMDVFVLFASPWNYLPKEKPPLLAAILNYSNVHLHSVNLQSFAVGTPVEDWLQRGDLFQSSNLAAHISYLLRLLVLYHFGGIYVDFDVLFLRDIINLPENYLGAESEQSLASSVLSFAPSGIGREFISECLRDFRQHFDASNWRKSGDRIISRVASKFCGTSNITKMLDNRAGCRGIQVHDWFAFYAIDSSHRQDFFDAARVRETVAQINGSYLLHLWNNELPAKFNAQTAYGKLAEQHCPKVYATTGE